ncbi:MAG: hypothetical protein NC121_14750 [Blautia sp.]|nr:hypothetical protein [Blautia sp.]
MRERLTNAVRAYWNCIYGIMDDQKEFAVIMERKTCNFNDKEEGYLGNSSIRYVNEEPISEEESVSYNKSEYGYILGKTGYEELLQKLTEWQQIGSRREQNKWN